MAVMGVLAALIVQVRSVAERYEDPADAENEQRPTVVEVKSPEDEKTKL